MTNDTHTQKKSQYAIEGQFPNGTNFPN